METPVALTPDIWERTPPEAQAYSGALQSRLSALEARVHALQEQNRTLEERPNQTSRNSSRPPSSDPPQSPRRRRTPSGRRVYNDEAIEKFRIALDYGANPNARDRAGQSVLSFARKTKNDRLINLFIRRGAK